MTSRMALVAPTTIVVPRRGPSVPSLILTHLVLAIAAFLFGPTIYKQFLPSKLTMFAAWGVHDVGALYPAWAAQHPGLCPTALDLVEGHRVPVVDPWGHMMTVQCAADGITVRSAGEDGELDTDDDIRWPR
jgi:hypothetical protein